MMHLFSDAMTAIVPAALRQLLCEKHLYQYVEVDLRPMLEVSKRISMELSAPGGSRGAIAWPPDTIKGIVASKHCSVNVPWTISGSHLAGALSNMVPFALPSINTFCSTCESRPPFNPIEEMSSCVLEPRNDEIQWYNLAYMCQQCKGAPVRFLVRREGLRLRLCGRDPIEAVPAPKFLPKGQSKFYSDAQIAHHAGQTLAAIFLLRTFVEQFWRSVPEVQNLIRAQPRATGDEQGSAYQDTLPVEFKNRFPSLSDVYGKLSAAMHEANADAKLFEESCQAVEEHFDACRLFKMMGNS